MDNPQLVAFVADAHPPLTAALARAARDTELGSQAAGEALITGLTRWTHVARTASPIGWCYLRGLEELRSAGVDLRDEDRAVLATDDPAAGAQRLDDLRTSTDPVAQTVDAEALVDLARRRRSLQALVGISVALGGVVVLALLLAWLQSPAI